MPGHAGGSPYHIGSESKIGWGCVTDRHCASTFDNSSLLQNTCFRVDPKSLMPKSPAQHDDSYDHGRRAQLCSKDSPQLSQSIKNISKSLIFWINENFTSRFPAIFPGSSISTNLMQTPSQPLAPTSCHDQIWHNVRGKLPQPTLGDLAFSVCCPL